MTLLYISYWGLSDGLTQATVFPNLNILLQSQVIKKVIFVTIERGGLPDIAEYHILHNSKIVYEPLHSKNYPLNLLNKIADFIVFPPKISLLLSKYKVDKVIARGAPAGALIYKVCERGNIPYFVESFEPHADYMFESGVWKQWDPRFIFEKKWEEAMKKSATALFPVAENYGKKLIKENVKPEKVFIVPVPVNIEQFKFNLADRERIRSKYKFETSTVVGIYVGKFGGIYYDNEAFQIFKKAFEFFGNFSLILLTPDSIEKVKSRVAEVGIPVDKVFVSKVGHSEVPAYLSASDFAFSTIKPANSRIYCSPTKDGEYWANGLPILITDGVGDDSDIIKRQGGGAVYNLSYPGSLDSAFTTMGKILQNPGYRDEIQTIATQYRSISKTEEAYQYFLN